MSARFCSAHRLLQLGTSTVLILLLVAPLAGCGARPIAPQPAPVAPATPTTPAAEPSTQQVTPARDATTPPSPSQATTPVVTPTTSAIVYFVRGEYLGVGMTRRVPTTHPARTAIEQLLAGPTSAEKTWGLGTAIPGGTQLLGLTVANGIATVNLSKRFESGGGTLSMSLRIAQVVKTLSQFDAIKRVAFKLDGQKAEWISGEGIMVWPPVKPSAYDDLLPAIMLESPTPGARITSPVRIRGTANVFEAVFRVKITDASGKVITDKQVKATSGTGTRGTFSAAIPFSTTSHGKGWLTVYERSAKDGSPINVVKIRVLL